MNLPISRKLALRRARANADIQEIVTYYLEQDATSAALDFIDELEAAITHIQTYPASGSPRYAHTEFTRLALLVTSAFSLPNFLSRKIQLHRCLARVAPAAQYSCLVVE